MDTREKIIGAAQARTLAQSGATVVSGHFDPLIASMAQRLQELKQNSHPLLVLIRAPPNAILPARARAELVAALQIVDFVCDEDLSIPTATELAPLHTRQLGQLIDHVHARQQAK